MPSEGMQLGVVPYNCYGKYASNVYSDFVFSNESAFTFTQRYVLLPELE